MSNESIHVIYDDAKERRVVIFRRPNGIYGYREEKHYKNDLASTEGWAVIWDGKSSYDSLETALREVPENVIWLKYRNVNERNDV